MCLRDSWRADQTCAAATTQLRRLHPIPAELRTGRISNRCLPAMRSLAASALPLLLTLLLTGCAEARTAIPTVQNVDLQRFMGRWYVIGIIPTRLERGNHNPVETYQLDACLLYTSRCV